jgi:hypothetical protein
MSQIGRGVPDEHGDRAQDELLSSAEEERVEALIKLKNLHDAGVLTDEQYAAEKLKIQKRA